MSAKWEVLRQSPGWEPIAQSAGEAWDAKIKDRKERQRIDEDEDDDDEWAKTQGYRNASAYLANQLKAAEDDTLSPVPVQRKDSGARGRRMRLIWSGTDQRCSRPSRRVSQIELDYTAFSLPTHVTNLPGRRAMTLSRR